MSLSSSTARRRRLAVALALVALLSPLAAGLATAQSVRARPGRSSSTRVRRLTASRAWPARLSCTAPLRVTSPARPALIRIAETGRVDGNVQVAAGTVVVDGAVGGNAELGAGSFELTETGRIDGSLDAGAGSISVDGAVGGDVRAAADSVVIGPNADVGGEFRYDAGTFTQSPDATVAGGVVEDTSLRGDTGVGFGGDLVPLWFGSAYGVAVNLVLGAVLLLAFPRFSDDVADRVSEGPLASGGSGSSR